MQRLCEHSGDRLRIHVWAFEVQEPSNHPGLHQTAVSAAWQSTLMQRLCKPSGKCQQMHMLASKLQNPLLSFAQCTSTEKWW